jgi:hypothetical protein
VRRRDFFPKHLRAREVMTAALRTATDDAAARELEFWAAIVPPISKAEFAAARAKREALLAARPLTLPSPPSGGEGESAP